jgi:DNA-binding transcriptional MerR regulator
VWVPEPGIRALLLALRGASRRRQRTGRDHHDDLGEEVQDEHADLLEELGVDGPALVVRSGGGRTGEVFTLDKPQITIGRSPDCDIFLDDVTVSRRHAVVAGGEGAFTIEDSGSLNGTFLNRPGSSAATSATATRSRSESTDSSSSRDDHDRTGIPASAAHDRLGLPPTAGDFPDISISKIRYLEDQGLLSPKRTRGGYRLFGEDDIERLETILRLQRDEFLPLRVIRQELASPTGKERKRRSGNLAAEETEIGIDELCERAGISQAQARELAEYGLLEAPLTPYDADTAAVCARLVAAGADVRHLRKFATAAGNQADLLEALVPKLRSRNRRPARVRSTICTGSQSSHRSSTSSSSGAP